MNKTLISAGVAIAASQMVIYVTKFVSTIVLAKLLAPEAFGLVAIVATINAAIAMISDIGIKPLVIKSERGGDADFLNTAWTVQILRGAWMSLIMLLIGGGLIVAQHQDVFDADSVYTDATLPMLIAASAGINFLLSFQSVKLFALERALRFRENLAIEVATQLAVTIFSIGLAYYVRNVWAIVLGGALGNMVQVIFSHTVMREFKQRFSLEKSALGELMKGGRWILASSTLSVVAYQGDKIIMGGGFSAADLGLYALAFNLITIATSIPSRIVGTMTMPVLAQGARTGEDELKSVFFQSRRIFDRVMVFCGGAAFTFGPLLVHILYDERYVGVGELVRALSFMLVFDRVSIPQQMYIAGGRFKHSFVFSAITTAYVVIALSLNQYLDGGLISAAIIVGLRNFPAYLAVLYFNWRHDVSDAWHELSVLGLWPVGAALGLIPDMLHLVK